MFFKKKPAGFDRLVVGLGNPGKQYENTRHNAGFVAADALAEKAGMKFTKSKFDALYGDCVIAGERVIIAKPQTFMNLSGRAVSKISAFYKIPLDKIIIMFDDTSLDVGKIRIRRKGSSGGQKGMNDIINAFGSEEIARIKIGVGQKPHPDYDMKDWVLGRIPQNKMSDFKKAAEQMAPQAVEEIIARGIDSAMNKFSK